MFWGLAIEPGKRYMQTVAKSFHISMASLELNNNDNDPVTLMFDYEGMEYILCNLHRQRAMQCQLDLNFQTGEKIAFYSSGKSRVHLSGYLVEEDDIELSDEEEEDEEEEESTPIKQSPVKKRKEEIPNLSGNKKPKLEVAEESDDEDDEMDDTFEGLKEEDDDDEEEEEDEDEEEEDSDEPQNKSVQNKSLTDKQKKNQGQTPQQGKTLQQNGQVQTPQSGKKKKNKNTQEQGETPKPGTPQIGASPQKEKVLAGGVVVQEVKVGNGPVAKPGRQVTVYYVGRLKQNNKQFDSTTGGPGFKFNLGRGEVIKGWDIGVAGMHVGGKRTITIPPQMAYGKKGQPPVIPPNSVLVFDVELRNVN